MDRYYTGITIEKTEDRLKKHIEQYYKGSHFTHSATDWIMVLTIQCVSIDQAGKIEEHIKRMKSKKYIKNLKQYPNIIEKLLKKYS